MGKIVWNYRGNGYRVYGIIIIIIKGIYIAQVRKFCNGDITSGNPAVIYTVTEWTQTLLAFGTLKITYLHAQLNKRLLSIGRLYDLDFGLHENSCLKI